MSANQYRGDFVAVMARRDLDTPLYNILQANWLNANKYKLFLMQPDLPRTGPELTSFLARHTDESIKRAYKTFIRSDHASFWYPNSLSNETIANTVLLTDLGPWRNKKHKNYYHSLRDGRQLLTRDNLMFLKNTIDATMATVLALADGQCS